MNNNFKKKIVSGLLICSMLTYTAPIFAYTNSETIYSRLDNSGNITKTIISTNVENKENGEDEIKEENTDKSSPIECKVTYELDGKVMNADEIVGKSGKVKIILDYTNTDVHNVTISGKKVDMYTPFVVLAGTIIDSDNNSNVEITNGKVIDDGSKIIAVGYVLPGMQESLDIDKDDLDIPSSIEITMDTTNFELNNIMTIATPEVFEDMDLDLDDIKDKLSDIDELEDAANEIADGAGKLNDGTQTLKDGVNTLADGASKLNDGAQTLDSSVGTLNTGVQTLNKGSQSLSTGANNLASGYEAVDNGINQLYEGITSEDGAAIGSAKISQGLTNLSSGLDNLKTELENNQTLTNDMTAIGTDLISITGYGINGSTNTYAKAIMPKGTEVTIQVNDTTSESVTGTTTSEVTVSGKTSDTVIVSGGISSPITVKSSDTTVQTNISSEVSSAISEALNQAGATLDQDSINAIVAKYSTKEVSVSGQDVTVPAGTQVQVAGTTSSDVTVTGNTSSSVTIAAGNASVKEYTGTLTKDYYATINLASALMHFTTLKNDLTTTMTSLKDGVSSLNTGAKTLDAGAKQLASGLNDAKDGITALKAGSSQIKEGTTSIAEGAKTLAEGTTTLANGTTKLKEGTTSLASGTKSLVDGTGSLRDGTNSLKDGTQELYDGIVKFNDEGISKIVDLVNDDVRPIINRVDKLQELSENYNSFGSDTKRDEITFISIMNQLKVSKEDSDEENAILTTPSTDVKND